MTGYADAKAGQFSFYTFQRLSINCYQAAQMRNRPVQLLHISESEYKVLRYRADAKAGQFSFCTFQRVSIKC